MQARAPAAAAVSQINEDGFIHRLSGMERPTPDSHSTADWSVFGASSLNSAGAKPNTQPAPPLGINSLPPATRKCFREPSVAIRTLPPLSHHALSLAATSGASVSLVKVGGSCSGAAGASAAASPQTHKRLLFLSGRLGEALNARTRRSAEHGTVRQLLKSGRLHGQHVPCSSYRAHLAGCLSVVNVPVSHSTAPTQEEELSSHHVSRRIPKMPSPSLSTYDPLLTPVSVARILPLLTA